MLKGRFAEIRKLENDGNDGKSELLLIAEIYGNKKRRVMVQNGGNLDRKGKCWKDGNLAKVRKLNYWQETAT